MDDFTDELDQFRRLMTGDVHRKLDALERLDQALTETDNQLLEFLDGMIRRHNERRSQIVTRLIEETRKYQIAPSADSTFGAALENNPHSARYLGGSDVQSTPSNAPEAQTWNVPVEPYGGWRQ
jgi:hypothetical protein